MTRTPSGWAHHPHCPGSGHPSPDRLPRAALRQLRVFRSPRKCHVASLGWEGLWREAYFTALFMNLFEACHPPGTRHGPRGSRQRAPRAAEADGGVAAVWAPAFPSQALRC